MNHRIQADEERNIATRVEAEAAERDQLTRCGFSTEEIVDLLWLRRWYQSGGSNRIPLVRHWEFLKRLVRSGRLDV